MLYVEKMGPLRGDGNVTTFVVPSSCVFVEKMGPPRGDGNWFKYSVYSCCGRREDGTPSRGRKHFLRQLFVHCQSVEKMIPLEGTNKIAYVI